MPMRVPSESASHSNFCDVYSPPEYDEMQTSKGYSRAPASSYPLQPSAAVVAGESVCEKATSNNGSNASTVVKMDMGAVDQHSTRRRRKDSRDFVLEEEKTCAC